MATKTVTELAGLFGVSRQAMNNRVRALEDEFLEKNDKGFTVVNAAGVHELERLYGRVVTAKQEMTDSSDNRLPARGGKSQDQTIFAMLSKLMEGKDTEIERLNEQIIVKDQQLTMLGGQIEAKDRQIAQKDKQLDQQQQLTAAALSDREQILLELKEEQNKGFFAKIFGKKKK
jgi:adenine-specific DNA methylase